VCVCARARARVCVCGFYPNNRTCSYSTAVVNKTLCGTILRFSDIRTISTSFTLYLAVSFASVHVFIQSPGHRLLYLIL
jgi:hypothetical protein